MICPSCIEKKYYVFVTKDERISMDEQEVKENVTTKQK
jgi:hypothetical protein